MNSSIECGTCISKQTNSCMTHLQLLVLPGWLLHCHYLSVCERFTSSVREEDQAMSRSRGHCTGEPKPRPPVRELLRVRPATVLPSPPLSPGGAAAEPPGVKDSWRTPWVTASTPSLTPSRSAAAAPAAALRHRAAAAALPCRCRALPPASSAAAAAAEAGAAWKLGAARALLLSGIAATECTDVALNAI